MKTYVSATGAGYGAACLLVVAAGVLCFAVSHRHNSAGLQPRQGSTLSQDTARRSNAAQVSSSSGANSTRSAAASGVLGASGVASVVSAAHGAQVPAAALAPGVVHAPATPDVTIGSTTYPRRTYAALIEPNDPRSNPVMNSGARLPAAWDIPAGGRQTVLAIIDSGFALQHEEFAGRWYQNTAETGTASAEQPSKRNCSDRALGLDASCNLVDDDADGIVDNESGAVLYQNPSRLNCTDLDRQLTRDCNQIDDDGNGYIDDVSGWDFVDGDSSAQAGELNPAGSGTTHGTMVAGVAAARGNNGVGIAGVDWSTRIMPLQALNDDGYGDTLGVGRAIYYAVQQHADVISISLGSSQPDAYVESAIRAAAAAGIVVVAAAGNSPCDCMVYPAQYTSVVGVGALDSTMHLASFSSWGQNLDVTAPGTDITTTTWEPGNQVSGYVGNAAGTSFSTPLVAGLMTRMLSHQQATPLQIVAALTETTNRLSLPAGVPHDVQYGYGAADAGQAMARIATPRSSGGAQQYVYTPVRRGAETASYPVYQCASGDTPGTPIYELAASGTSFFTISSIERDDAMAGGYTSSVFGYGCLGLPADSYQVPRNVNLYKEFRNITDKTR